MKELHGLAAGDENDDFVVLRTQTYETSDHHGNGFGVQHHSLSGPTLHLSRMNAARHTSRILLGTTTTNCLRASGTAKLSDGLAGSRSEVTWEEPVRSEEGGPETWMLTGSFKHTSANRLTPATQRKNSVFLFVQSEFVSKIFKTEQTVNKREYRENRCRSS